jgi:crotonobetainyl-CoA:carnitine CoA-transferase CaiB-like acyl-CoA transferase
MSEGTLLTSLRILDLSAGDGDAVSRILADLGADALKVEPPGGAPARSTPPTVGGVSSGGHVHISQAEAAINQLAEAYVIESARAAGLSVADEETALESVVPCASVDEWCVISLRSPSDRSRLAEVLQRAGVAAGPMNRAVDMLADPQVLSRTLFGELSHPLLEQTMPAEAAPAAFSRIPSAPQRPAPMPGEHTREICERILGSTTAQIDALIADGALFAPQSTLLATQQL